MFFTFGMNDNDDSDSDSDSEKDIKNKINNLLQNQNEKKDLNE